MNHLIIYTHPNPASFNNAIKDRIENISKQKGHNTRIRDLYAIGFDPQLKASDFEAFQHGNIPADIQEEQNHIAWADVITFVYPIWWTGLPATLKGYIDRVFSYGFAYEYGEEGPVGLLTGKKVFIVNTTGTPNDMYAENGMHGALRSTSDTGIFDFCGMKVLEHLFYGFIPFTDEGDRKEYLEDVERIARGIL